MNISDSILSEITEDTARIRKAWTKLIAELNESTLAKLKAFDMMCREAWLIYGYSERTDLMDDVKLSTVGSLTPGYFTHARRFWELHPNLSEEEILKSGQKFADALERRGLSSLPILEQADGKLVYKTFAGMHLEMTRFRDTYHEMLKVKRQAEKKG